MDEGALQVSLSRRWFLGGLMAAPAVGAAVVASIPEVAEVATYPGGITLTDAGPMQPGDVVYTDWGSIAEYQREMINSFEADNVFLSHASSRWVVL